MCFGIDHRQEGTQREVAVHLDIVQRGDDPHLVRADAQFLTGFPQGAGLGRLAVFLPAAGKTHLAGLDVHLLRANFK